MLKINPAYIRQAADKIKTGAIVVFPTTDLYGLGVDAFNSKAIAKVFQIKKRPLDKPLLVLIPNLDYLSQIVIDITETASKLISKFWPGGLTLIFKAHHNVPKILTAGSNKIGVRLPVHPVAAKLVRAVGGPVTATSANLAGTPGCSSIDQIDAGILDQVDLLINHGSLRGGRGSTVVDVSGREIKIIRPGRIIL